jgi:hypothetical protein
MTPASLDINMGDSDYTTVVANELVAAMAPIGTERESCGTRTPPH